MPSVFTLSGTKRARKGSRKRRRTGKGLAGYVFSVCPRGRVALREVRLDRGGYDSDGRYWGANIHGVGRLFAVDDGERTEHLRASDRAAAKRKLQAECPAIRFTR